MTLANYNNFCKNPLTLEERFPTIEEFALTFDDFFILKKNVNRTDYDELFSAVRDGLRSSEHKKALDRDTIKKYIECFDLGSCSKSVDSILTWYIDAINKSTASDSTKNAYIRQWFRYFFAKAYCIRESTTNWKWLGNIPASEDGNDFFTYLSCLDEKKIKEKLKDENNKKNFKNWITNKQQSKDFVKIKSVLAFLDDVNSDGIIVNKENLLISWFYTKCYKHFPCNEMLLEKYGKKGKEKESPYSHRIEELVNVIDGPKNDNAKEKIEREIDYLKECTPPTDYPVLLYMEFKNNFYLGNYEKAVFYARQVSYVFFYVGSTGNYTYSDLSTLWYRILIVAMAFISYNSTDSKVKTAATKLFTSLLKYSYLVHLELEIAGYDDSENFVYNNSEKLESLRKQYCNQSDSFFLPSSFYEKKKHILSLEYDENKLNQKIISFGNTSGYAIEIASQINNPEKVKEIIAKGGNVLKAKDPNKNTLFWCINNMLLFLPIGFWRIVLVPHSLEHISNDDIINFIIPNARKTLKKYYDYNKVHAEELENAYKIFKMILPAYKEADIDVSRLTFRNDQNLLYTVCNIGKCTIVEDVIPLFNIETVKNDSNNYFLAVLETYKQLWAKNNGCKYENPYVNRVNQFIKSPEYFGDGNTRELSLFYNELLTQNEFLFDSSCSFIDENELLKIIDLLINLHFDPCKDIPKKPHDFPYGVIPLYDCTLFAIEMGWLKCVKRLCTYLIAEYNDHWEKMKKSYFAEAMWQWQMRNPQCIRYPSENEQKLILKYLASLLK